MARTTVGDTGPGIRPAGIGSEMKKFTQKQFDKLPLDAWGRKQCPLGDYTAIKSFGEWCIFGGRCSFGEGCIFGGRCSFGEWCIFGGSCIFGGRCKAKSPYWSFVYDPPFETEGKIYPTEQARSYWECRLGLELKGCYEEIEKQIKPLIPEILARTDLTKCERRIIESWR